MTGPRARSWTGAYHVSPETAGKDRKESTPEDEEISPEAMAVAYLMRGIHF